MVRAFATLAVAAVLVLPATAAVAQYSCRGYPSPRVLGELKPHVEMLRRVEREAADRLIGLDTRTFEWLLDQARAAHAKIAVPILLQLEEETRRCRNYVRPVRGDCAAGGAALLRVVADLVAGEATSETRTAYAQAMRLCELGMDLAPLDTALRGSK